MFWKDFKSSFWKFSLIQRWPKSNHHNWKEKAKWNKQALRIKLPLASSINAPTPGINHIAEELNEEAGVNGRK